MGEFTHDVETAKQQLQHLVDAKAGLLDITTAALDYAHAMEKLRQEECHDPDASGGTYINAHRNTMEDAALTMLQRGDTWSNPEYIYPGSFKGYEVNDDLKIYH